jgi:putative O-methyltransferase
MSAGSLPYHLRPNKAVDRFLFLDLLSRIDQLRGIDESFDYVGFGGPQMEDFRIIHERLPRLSMFSIEGSGSVIPRQRFNRPHTRVEIAVEPMYSGDWLAEWEPARPVVIWFDYALKAQRVQQFTEFQKLLRRAPSGSIVRITMNAELPKADPATSEEQFHIVEEQFRNLLPTGISANDITAQRFPVVLLGMFHMAADEVLEAAGERRFQPLLLVTYRDTHQMLTVTGLIDTPEQCDELIAEQAIAKWEHSCLNWDTVRTVRMPDLTLKERIHINQLLPQVAPDAGEIQNALGFQLDELEAESLAKITDYTKFYRHFPQFTRVAV